MNFVEFKYYAIIIIIIIIIMCKAGYNLKLNKRKIYLRIFVYRKTFSKFEDYTECI